MGDETAESRRGEQRFAELVHRVAKDDRDAFAALYDETSRLIYGFVLRILSDSEDAAEVTADVYLQVWRSAGGFDASRGRVSAWMFTMARTRAIDRLRAGRARRKGLQGDLAEAENLAAPAPAPDVDWEMKERRARVRGAMEALPQDQRDVLEIAYWSGLSQSEIAAKLRLPLGTVKTRMRLGMIKLREMLQSADRME